MQTLPINVLVFKESEVYNPPKVSEFIANAYLSTLTTLMV